MLVINILVNLTLASGPARIETAYIAPMSHTDIGFTAPPHTVAGQAAQRVCQALELARQNSDYVWNFEVFWELDQWLDPQNPPGLPLARPTIAPSSMLPASTRPATGELVDLVRRGRFGIGAAYVNPHTSLMTSWTLDRLFSIPTDWARRHGLTLDWAVINDVPGHPPDLPRFLATNGVRYLALGVNQSLSRPLPSEICNVPFWWEAPDGSRVLTWISAKAYTEAFVEYGLDPGTARFFNPKEFTQIAPLDVMRHGMAKLLEDYRKRNYPYDAVLLLHAFDNWDAAPSGRLPAAVRLWNESGGKPRLVLATPGHFFRHIEQTFGSTLPVHRGGFGGQWELVRTGAPSAMTRARFHEEQLLKEDAQLDPVNIRRLLVYWEHSHSLGPPWPGYFTPELAVEHNRQQWQIVAGWPLPRLPHHAAAPAKSPPPTTNSPFQPNGLYLAASTFITWNDFKPLPQEAWLTAAVEQAEAGVLRCRHRIDRKKLPDPARVIWAWKLTDADAAAPVIIRTATGTTRWPDDGLAGYAQFHWIAPWGFQIGTTRFTPHGPFAFARPSEHPGWLLSYVLGQNRSAVFKGGQKGQMTFDQAYPGEEPVYEFAIDICTTHATSPPKLLPISTGDP